MAEPTKRTHYFDHQFLREADFTIEQEYHTGMRRRHNRLLHTWGIADGLEVPDPPAGSTAVTINEGTAYDSQGQEIVLAESRPLELSGFPGNADVFITIAYAEELTDPSAETGAEGNTRSTENPLIEASQSRPAPSEVGTKIVLAQVSRTGNTVRGVNRSERRSAGVVGGDLEVRSLALTDPGVVSTQWPRIRLGAGNRADVEGSLRVGGNLNVEGTIQGDLADGSVRTAELANGAVSEPKLANNAVSNRTIQVNAVTAAKIADGNVGTAELANGAVSEPKLANNAVSNRTIQDNAVTASKIASNTINEIKFDAATRGKIVTNGNSHDHSGGDGATIRHSRLSKDDGRNPHGTRAIDVGALPNSGGTVNGTVTIRRTGSGAMTAHGTDLYGVLGRLTTNVTSGFSWSQAAVVGISELAGHFGVFARAPGGTHSLFVSGTSRFTGAKTGYVVDTFVNASGQRLKTGDVVKLKGTPIAGFQGDNNKIPVAEVTMVDKESDSMVIGIVDRESIPDPDTPDTRVGAEDPTFIEDGGELLVVTLGAYAHCKVDASEAPIEVGDLLTSAGNLGHAKKATDPKIGSIIGKALEPLKVGAGYIAVFVNIQ